MERQTQSLIQQREGDGRQSDKAQQDHPRWLNKLHHLVEVIDVPLPQELVETVGKTDF